MAKQTAAQLRQRVGEIVEMRLAGASWKDLRAHADAPGDQQPAWGTTDKQLQDLVDASDQVIAGCVERDAAKAYALHIAQRQALFARCLAVGDYGTAHGLLKDLAKLQAVYETMGEPVDPLERFLASLPPEQSNPLRAALVEAFALPKLETCAETQPARKAG